MRHIVQNVQKEAKSLRKKKKIYIQQQQQQQQKRNIEFSLPNPNKRNEVANSGIANGTVEQAGPVTCPKAQKKYIRTVIALEPAIRKTRSGKKKKTKKKKMPVGRTGEKDA
ncbi:Uncharacterized protein APZ42_018602 [Daphnia magna]|uniref:Uncharacterized protein n=1 Tax=Daphnia magna TaxID=35525 RepID=A0A164YZJ8_9CRUS|nr:Uncharacterized protein APZ42_018602 [Daphnia magna]